MKLTGLDKVEAWKGEGSLPPGAHEVTIESLEEGTSKNNHPQWTIEYGNDLGSIREWMVVIPESYGKVRRLIEAAGIEVKGGDWEFDPSTLVGRKVRIIVGEEPSQDDPNKKFRRVQAQQPPQSGNGQGAAADNLPF